VKAWRWWVCTVVVAVFVALPFVVRYAPVSTAATSASSLLSRMASSASLPFAGYAESTGSLALPATDQLNDVANLLSGRTQMRVWWLSAQDWRVDTISPAGERSTRTFPQGVAVWDYEDNRMTYSPAERPGTIRLPRDTDTVPPQLAGRLLADADPNEVTLLPSRRVAGRPADGLRLSPSDPRSSVSRVDVWADSESGIPVLVEVFSRASDVPAMTSTFLDFTDVAPTAADLRLAPPPGARIRTDRRSDLLGDVARSSGPQPPATLLGFSRSTPVPGLAGVGAYGKGVTQLVVAALPPRVAGPLRDQLVLAASTTQVPGGITLSVGPVGLLLTEPLASGWAWLFAGTLTPDGLTSAAAELAAAAS
jgi:hypothetical protein